MNYNYEPVCINDFEAIAQRTMPSNAWGYYDSGADSEQTKHDNIAAFNSYRLHPRMLRDVSNIDTHTTILGQRMATPIGVSPCAMHKLAHPDGESATSRAVASMDGSIMILSTYSSTSLEKVIAEGTETNTQYWLQLYVYQGREVSEMLVRRAEKAGFRAIVLTVDAPVLGKRIANVRNQFMPPPHVRLENFANLEDNSQMTFGDAFSSKSDQSLCWKTGIAWLKSISQLPIIVKGVLSGEDTQLAIENGCAGVIVSNHGGRQLDGTLSSIDALPQVVEAAGDRIEVYMDGGVRKGTDVFKALALGARAVFVARPILWGLAYRGEEGAARVLEILQEELVLAMRLTGTKSIDEIDGSYVYQPANRWIRNNGAKL